MSNELLDFTNRDNFDFFQFHESRGLSPEEIGKIKGELKTQCENVLEYAHATVQDMCLLGFHLKELKESGKWEWVVSPVTKMSFLNYGFADFCEYAFGLSKTKTSDLLRIAKFVKISGGKTGFIEEMYAKYNTSQLIELAAVNEEDRKYFNPEMPVAKMRKVKDYMKNSLFYVDKQKPDFDINQKMEEYQKEKEGKAKGKSQEDRPNVIPGQIELGEEVFEPEQEEENPISVLKTFGGEADKFWSGQDYDKEKMESQLRAQGVSERTIEKIIEFAEEDEEDPYDMPMQTHSYDSDYSPDEEVATFPPDEDLQSYDEEEEQEENKYDFTRQAGIRAFLKDYKNWPQVCDFIGRIFRSIHGYTLKNGVSILATGVNVVCGKGDEIITAEKPLYWIRVNINENAIMISKEQIEAYIVKHRAEL